MPQGCLRLLSAMCLGGRVTTGLLRAAMIPCVRPCAKVVISSNVNPTQGGVAKSSLMRGGAFTAEGVASSSSDSYAPIT